MYHMSMKCLYCDKEFISQYNWQKYCNSKCRGDNRVAIVRKWRQEHKEEYARSRAGEYGKWNTERKRAQALRYKKYSQTMRGKLTHLNLHVKHRGQSSLKIKYEDFTNKFGNKNWSCIECGAVEDLTFDHILSFKLGGEHTIENIQIMCRKHNSIKGCYERYEYKRILDKN